MALAAGRALGKVPLSLAFLLLQGVLLNSIASSGAQIDWNCTSSPKLRLDKDAGLYYATTPLFSGQSPRPLGSGSLSEHVTIAGGCNVILEGINVLFYFDHCVREVVVNTTFKNSNRSPQVNEKRREGVGPMTFAQNLERDGSSPVHATTINLTLTTLAGRTCSPICPPGVKCPLELQLTFRDIDECLSMTHQCRHDQNCVNTVGSYSCANTLITTAPTTLPTNGDSTARLGASAMASSLTSAAATASSLTSAASTASSLTSAAVTASSLTSAAATASSLTSAAATASSLTNAATTASSLTSAATTVSSLTSAATTVSSLTSAATTVSSLTSAAATASSPASAAAMASSLTGTANTNTTAFAATTSGAMRVGAETMLIQTNKDENWKQFKKDTMVELNCSVRVKLVKDRSETDIEWVFNNATKLTKTSPKVVQRVSSLGVLQSTLTIASASSSNVGEYWCRAVRKQGVISLSPAVTLNLQVTKFKEGAPKSRYVVKYGRPLSFACNSTDHHSVLCLVEKITPQGVDSCSRTCRENTRDGFYRTSSRRTYQIDRLTEKYQGSWKCKLTRGLSRLPPKEESTVIFDIAIQEEAPQRTTLDVSVSGEDIAPESFNQMTPWAIQVPSTSSNGVSTLYVRDWLPQSKLVLNLTCKTQETVYPAAKIELTAPGLSFNESEELNLVVLRSQRNLQLTSARHIVPGVGVTCTASNKLGNATSTVNLAMGSEPLAIPVNRFNRFGQHGTLNESVVVHVYGNPLTTIKACVKVRDYTGWRCSKKFAVSHNFSKQVGSIGTAGIHFAWTHGYMDRGNPYGEAIFTFVHGIGTKPTSQLLKNATFKIRAHNSFTDTLKTEKFTILNITKKEKHPRLPGDQTAWPSISSLVTSTSRKTGLNESLPVSSTTTPTPSYIFIVVVAAISLCLVVPPLH